MLSLIKEREERQRSLSPNGNLSLDARDYNQEPVGSLGQQSNNSDIMEMMRKME